MKTATFLISLALAMPAAAVPLNVQIHYVETYQQACDAAVAYAATVPGATFGFIATDSMEPHFPAKLTVHVIEPGEPEVGQAPAFKHNGQTYIHQLTQKGAGRYVTSGTNVAAPDAGYRTRKDLVGVVRQVWVAKSR